MSQSRWVTGYLQHPFQNNWAQLKEQLASLQVDDQTVVTAVNELARLKRVVSFLDGVLSTVDPDLTPVSVWNTFNPQLEACLQQVRAYASNKDIQLIVKANEHADNLLTYVRPYMVLPAEVVPALRRSAESYSSQLGEYIEAFQKKATSIVDQISSDKKASAKNVTSVEAAKDKIEGYSRELFEGTDGSPSIQKSINDLKTAAEDNASKINELHVSLIVGTPQAESTQAKVKAAEADVVASREKIRTLLESVQDQTRQLLGFHEKVFGKKDDPSGKPVGGLEAELDTRMTQLAGFEIEQKQKHDALFAQIEALLPGATSAGLASAYKSLKDNFKRPIAIYTSLFYGALLTLVFGALVMVVKQVTFSPQFAVQFIEVADWDFIFKALLYKVPFIAPVVWLALFSSARRSQYERLQQEYAHKEALASSYESYKKQLQDLQGSDSLQRELIAKAIDAIAYNASVTLEGKHEEKLPIQQLLEKLSGDDIKRLIELVRDGKTPPG